MKPDGAIFHYSGKVITRSAKGADGSRVSKKSVVAAAAYQSGERLVLTMERNPFGLDMQEKTAGLVVVHDYTPKAGDVAYKAILAPDGAPAWVQDRETLWNRVEASEKRVDAQLARSLDIALPRSLTHEQRVDLVQGFVAEHFTSTGMVADVAFHYDADNHNPHCHILLTMRKLEGDGFASTKCKEWQPDFTKVGDAVLVGSDRLTKERESWATFCNAALIEAGKEHLQVDHRTLAAQGIDRAPTFHLSKEAVHSERKGQVTRIGERFRALVAHNQVMDRLKHWRQSLKQTPAILHQHLARAREALQDWQLSPILAPPVMQHGLEPAHAVHVPPRSIERMEQHHHDYTRNHASYELDLDR